MIPGGLKEVTADWLNGALHKTGLLKDIDILSLEIQPMGVGEGFQSDMARLIPRYSRDASSLPRTMIAKLPTSYEPANAVAVLFNTYEREIRFYAEVAKHSPLRTPRLIYCDFDAALKKYALILEDCSCYTQIDQIKGLDYEMTKTVALKVADFHARWWDSPELQKFTWMPKPGDALFTAFMGFYRSCWDVAVQSPDFLAALPPGGREAGLKIYEHFPWLIETTPNNHLTIAHFDFRADNLFFDFGNKEDLIIVFDWQAANVNRGVIDLSYLLGGSISADIRRKSEKEILRLYHQRLIDRGVRGYSSDECWADYLKGTLVYAYIPVLAYSQLDISDDRAKKLATMLTQRHFGTIVENSAASILPSG
jgi:hypothetical protein